MPARIRAATYSSVRLSTTTDSTPSAASRCASSRPAGPAPTMATSVRMPASLASSRRAAYRGLPLAGSSLRDLPIPRAATCSAATRRGRSLPSRGSTMPSAATTDSSRRIGTATEQAPSDISSTVVA